MIEIEIEDPAWLRSLPGASEMARAAAEAALEGWDDQSLVILLADDEAVRDLNTRFRGKDAPTNVLSFPAGAHAGGHLGDVALASGVCAREAAEQGKPLGDHLRHLVIHGVLHLLGYDHDDEAEAERMEALERDLLTGLGVADPYAFGDDVQHTR
jgi:probable rRNA maturation factor